jgi:hypothetical protein
MEYFSIDIDAIKVRCEERGDIRHVRYSIRDFDPFDLRRKLPKAVAKLSSVHDPKAGKAYIHCTAGGGALLLLGLLWASGRCTARAAQGWPGACACSHQFILSHTPSPHHTPHTPPWPASCWCHQCLPPPDHSLTATHTQPPAPCKGMGRAPGVALAYVSWLRNYQLADAWEKLRSIRRCSPRLESIRAATCDLLLGSGAIDVTVSLRRRGTAQHVQVRVRLHLQAEELWGRLWAAAAAVLQLVQEEPDCCCPCCWS